MRINGFTLPEFESLLRELFMGTIPSSAYAHWLTGVDVFEASRIIVEGI